MKRTNYDTFLDILSDIFESDEKITENDLIETYGKKMYNQFSRHCLGGLQAFVMEKHDKDNPGRLQLTPDGLKFFLEMRKNDEHFHLNKVNIQAYIGSTFLLLAAFLYNNFIPNNGDIFWILFFVAFLAILIGYGANSILQAALNFRSVRR